MRAELRRGAALCACALAAGCGTIQPEVAYPTTRAAAPASQAPAARLPAAALGGKWDSTLAGLRAEDQRVADIGYRIALANAELCPDHAPLSGLLLQSALQYSPRLRPAAEALFHIDARPAVEAVAAGSPAAAAGLKVGDILVAVDGRPLPRAAAGADQPASYLPVQQALSAIDAAMRTGQTQLTVERAAAPLHVTLAPKQGCAYDAQVTPGPELNASADGRHVFITTGLASYVRSDDMLALVLGHEYAHDLLHHHDRLDRKGFARGVLGELGSSPASLIVAEKEADYVGLYLTARAGYDISAAPDFWRRFPKAIGDFGWSHPGAWERAASLAATRDEILAKQRRGEPLTPNPAGGGER
ncbi:MAG TPA: M48 family metallopeptidase [Caulobacteraceae bacterium]|jgi:hypothetical protein